MSLLRRIGILAARFAYTVPRIGFGFTVGLATPKYRRLFSQLSTQLGFTECAATVPEVAPSGLVDATRPVVMREAEVVDGNVGIGELLFLAQLVRTRSPRRLFEIGTFDGRTTLAFAANSPEDAVVYTLDLPSGMPTARELAPGERAFVEKASSGVRVHGTELAGKVRQLFGDSATFDFSAYRADMVFVDGSHAYEYVLSDSRSALAMLGSAGGTIVWHDYGNWSGVTRALNELQRDHPAFAALRHVTGTTFAILTV